MNEPLDEKHVISFHIALDVAIIIVLTYSTISILLSEGNLKSAILNILIIITEILASLCLIYAAYNSGYNKKVQIAWVLLAVSRLCFTSGDIIYAYLESVLDLENPFPSIADIGFLAFYPLFALGIMILPRLPMTSGEKLKVYLDIGIVMVSSFLVFWILLI